MAFTNGGYYTMFSILFKPYAETLKYKTYYLTHKKVILADVDCGNQCYCLLAQEFPS